MQKPLYIAAAYFIIFSTLSILKHSSFHTTAFDLGIFDNTVWMFSQGISWINMVNGFYPFADHIQPILYLPAIIYKITPSPIVLLILQAIAISLGAIPIYLLAKSKLGEKIATLLVFVYFLYPPIMYLSLFDFHAEAFLVTFLLFALYFLEKMKVAWALAFAALAGLTKEYIPVVFIAFAAYLAYRKKTLAAILSAAIGAGWLFVNYGIILKAYEFTSLSIYTARYPDPISAILGLLTVHKIGYVLLMLIPLLLLPLLAPEFLIMAGPAFAIVLLKKSTAFYDIIYQHSAFIAPFLLTGAIVGFHRLQNKIPAKKIAIALCAASIISFAAIGPFTTIYKPETFNAFGEHAAAGREMLKLIPEEANVSATTWAVPHLSARSRIYMFPAPFVYHGELPEKQKAQWFDATPQYVVLDTSRPDIMISEELIKNQSCRIAAEYGIIYNKDGWVLLERGRGEDAKAKLCQN